MTEPIRIGVIGLQFAKRVHIPAFRADSRCTIAAIAGRDAEKSQRGAREMNVPEYFADWREMVASPNIDAVSVGVPPVAQAQIVAEAAKYQKHVFCEKPLASSMIEAEKLLRAVESNGVVHAIDFLFPEIPAWRRARELLVAGDIGDLRHFSYVWKVETRMGRSNLESWKTDSGAGGGVFGNFFSHVFYNIEWLIGSILEIEASSFLEGYRTHCAAECRVKLAGGLPGNITVRTDAFLGQGHRIELYGEKGTIILHNPTWDYAAGFHLKLGTRANPEFVSVLIDSPVNGVDGRIAPVQRIARRFLDAITVGGEVKPNLGDGLRIQSLLEQATMLATAP